MTRLAPLLTAVLAVGVPLGAVASSQAASTLALDAAASISSYRGYLAYSIQEADRFRLQIRRPDGVTITPPLPDRSVAFDVDLGPGIRTGVDAVYSRCARESATTEADGLPAYSLGQRCSVYRWSIGSARERRILDAADGRSYVLPAVWRARVVAAAHEDDRPARVGLRVIGATATERRALEGVGPGRTRASIKGLDLRGRALALTWRYHAGPGGAFPADDREVTEVRLNRVGSAPVVLGRVEMGPESTRRAFSAPAILAKQVRWTRWAAPGSSFNARYARRLLGGATARRRTKAVLPSITEGWVLRIGTGRARSARDACRPICRLDRTRVIP